MNDLSDYRIKNAIFDSMRTVLAEEGVDYKKHAGVIAHFQKEYIKTQKFANISE